MNTRTKTIFRSLGVAACVGVLAASGVGVSASAATAPQTDGGMVAESAVPPNLVPPAGNSLSAAFVASGVQVYRCTAGAWAFVEPAASLTGWAKGTRSAQTTIHFRGPSWESTVDGSLVEARAIANSPVAGSIPQLLLQATTNRGDGVFGRVTYIQRLATDGGVAPAGTCVEGATTGVRYRAVYRFFVPA